MKIAIASESGIVTEHFGHCQQFEIYEVENGLTKKKEVIPNPGHRPGFLPIFLGELGVSVVISGGMGSGAVDLFNEKGIEVILGASGNTQEVVQQYIQGSLASTGSICHEHLHHDDCHSQKN